MPVNCRVEQKENAGIFEESLFLCAFLLGKRSSFTRGKFSQGSNLNLTAATAAEAKREEVANARAEVVFVHTG